MSEDFEQISDEEKLKIAQHFLLSSPPGQFHDVMKDVSKLLPEGLLTENLANGIAKVYNNRNGKIAESPAGNKVVLSSKGEIDASHYFDPIAEISFGIDHLSLKTSEESGDLPATMLGEGATQSLRKAVQSAVGKYVKGHYSPSNEAAGSVFLENGAEGSCLVIHLAGERTNIRNFWSGRWTSCWVYSLTNSTIVGDVKIHAHYFEDGNVQLQTNKHFPATNISNGGDVEDNARNIVQFISTSESAVQNGMEEMFMTMKEETFQSMRRVLPVTRQKMEWNINAVRMIRQVRK